uniref:CCA tRNA nucleotidyltransferase 1, mitochondrial n=1 Tax=Caenorhabditis tropicalis TaxID=1561998 RepID=A0A1I7U2T5_9PELO
MEPIEPKILKIEDNEDFRALFTPELLKLRNLFAKRDYELRIAGGAVRDLLMNIRPADVDFASTATPTQMKTMFEEENIRMLHKRGEEHGTITCRIDEKENFEITTLRVDIVCDGRRAQVEYTTNWQLDANRRDLTINSLFLDLHGNVVDYFDGIRDIETRRIAFVGDARQRIQEDYLRILRYFRFFGRIANSSEHEPDTIQAIIENRDGMAGISAERIWTELKKIVVGRMADEVMKAMIERCGLQKYLGLPEECNLDRFHQVYSRHPKTVEPMTMIACLCEEEEQIAEFHRITKLSNDERLLGEFILHERNSAIENLGNDDWWIDRIVDLEVRPGHENHQNRLRQRLIQLARSILADEQRIQMIEAFEAPKFPVTGRDLMGAGVRKGPHVRNILYYLYEIWKKSRFTMTMDALLEHAQDPDIPDISKKERKRSPPRGKK